MQTNFHMLNIYFLLDTKPLLKCHDNLDKWIEMHKLNIFY